MTTVPSRSHSRKAAEKGSVHPIYLDGISEKFALMIERNKDLPRLYDISRILLTEYSERIWQYSNSECSSLIKKAIHYILLYIDYPLTLEEIARTIYVNPVHLSRKFKSEPNMTPTQFILALLVGFNDSNYF